MKKSNDQVVTVRMRYASLDWLDHQVATIPGMTRNKLINELVAKAAAESKAGQEKSDV